MSLALHATAATDHPRDIHSLDVTAVGNEASLSFSATANE